MAGGSTLPRVLDSFAAACYRLRQSALARWGFLILAALSLGLTLFSRPGQVENQTVRDAAIGDISIASINTYVRVSGILDVTRVYTTSYNLGGLNLYGSRYVPLVTPDASTLRASDAVFVIDENLPPHDLYKPVTFVAQVMAGEGTQQPPLYLQIGYPPNVVLANLLARLGSFLLFALIVIALLAWIVERVDYALPLPWDAALAANAPALLWFGELGRQFNDIVVRSQPAQFNATPHEARFESATHLGLWSVSVRRLKSVQLFDVATTYGAMPAARLRFEDERGLQRHGVVAASSAESRDAVLRVLSLIR